MERIRWRLCVTFVAVGLHIGVTGLASAQTRHLRVIALAEDPAPGYSQPEKFSAFLPASINNFGEVAFVGVSTLGRGIWKSAAGSLQPVALTGTHAPGTSGDARFALIESPHINNMGEVTFSTSLGGNDVNGLSQLGIWTTTGGTLRKVVRQGDPVPRSSTLPGEQLCFSCSNPGPSLANGGLFCPYNFMDRPLFNDTGLVVFKSQLSAVTPDMAENPFPFSEEHREEIWMNRNGVATKVIGLGEGVLAGDNAIRWFPQSLHSFAKLNDKGDFAFTTFAQNGGGSWLLRHDAAPGAFETIVAPNTPVDHVGSGLTIAGAALEGFNNNRQVLFQTAFSGPGVTSLNDASLWLKDDLGLHLLAREGDAIPGTSFQFGRAGFPNFGFGSPALSGNGTAAFAAQIGNADGIFTADVKNGLQLRVHSGMQAPGLAPGVTFTGAIGGGGNIAINQFGQIAFYASLKLPNVGGAFRSVWVTDRTGTLQLVFMDGQMLEYLPGQFRQLNTGIAGGLYSGNQEGAELGLNDRGEVVFTTDWGVFVSSVGTIPEPSSTVLLLLGLIMGMRRC